MSKVVYILAIPPGFTAHQAYDNKYYRRRNFIASPMEHYEVRELLMRESSPKLELSFDPLFMNGNLIRINPYVENKSLKIAHNVRVSVEFLDFNNYFPSDRLGTYNSHENIRNSKHLYVTDSFYSLYYELPQRMGSLQFEIVSKDAPVKCEVKVYADNMSPILKQIEIRIINDRPIIEII